MSNIHDKAIGKLKAELNSLLVEGCEIQQMKSQSNSDKRSIKQICNRCSMIRMMIEYLKTGTSISALVYQYETTQKRIDSIQDSVSHMLRQQATKQEIAAFQKKMEYSHLKKQRKVIKELIGICS